MALLKENNPKQYENVPETICYNFKTIRNARNVLRYFPKQIRIRSESIRKQSTSDPKTIRKVPSRKNCLATVFIFTAFLEVLMLRHLLYETK